MEFLCGALRFALFYLENRCRPEGVGGVVN